MKVRNTSTCFFVSFYHNKKTSRDRNIAYTGSLTFNLNKREPTYSFRMGQKKSLQIINQTLRKTMPYRYLICTSTKTFSNGKIYFHRQPMLEMRLVPDGISCFVDRRQFVNAVQCQYSHGRLNAIDLTQYVRNFVKSKRTIYITPILCILYYPILLIGSFCWKYTGIVSVFCLFWRCDIIFVFFILLRLNNSQIFFYYSTEMVYGSIWFIHDVIL